MFGHSYFGAPYYGPRYFGQSSGPVSTVDRLGGHRRRPDPDELLREQRMVAEYLRSLEQKPAKRKATKPSVSPELTTLLVKAASDAQLQQIIESERVLAQEREKAIAEHRRRYWAAFLTLALH